jgi:hypothetical protein
MVTPRFHGSCAARLIALAFALCLLFGVAAWSPAALDKLPLINEMQYFGLYVKKQKVGWRATRIERDKRGQIVVSNTAEISQSIGGRSITMKTSDRRSYDRATGALQLIDYRMEGPTGATTLRGIVSGKTLTLTTVTGGQLTTDTLPAPTESLADQFAIELAILEGRAANGLELTVGQFDPTVKKTLGVHLSVLPPETRMIAGVERIVYPVSGQIAELGAPISAVYDSDARLLQSNLSILEAVWEDEQQARSKAALGNLLEPMAVKPPTRMRISQPVEKLTAVFSGVPEARRLNTDSQIWSKAADGAMLTIVRPAFLVSATPLLASIDNTAQVEWLARDARIQTDDPAILKQAAILKKGAATTGELAQRILDWVYKNIDKQYTPTFSNASETMKTRVGDCGEHAVLYVALARAAGLPAREVVGLVYSNELGGFGYHAWAEVWIGRWAPVDPSWGQFPADASHIAFAFGGMEKQAEIISLMDAIELRKLETEP